MENASASIGTCSTILDGDYPQTTYIPLATGESHEAAYEAGTTKGFHFEKGEFMLHDLANIRDTELVFTTVEFKNSPNSSLPI